MKQLILLVISVSVFSFFMITCSSENNPADENNSMPEFMAASHFGCQSLNKIAGSDTLEYFEYKNDTLLIKINFTANCCPDFKDSVNVTKERIQIFLYDALANCRCVCPYADEYKFYYPGFTSATIEFWQASIHSVNYEMQFSEKIDL